MKLSEVQLHNYITDIILEENGFKKEDKLPEILSDTDLQSVGMNSMLFIQFIVFLENTYSIEIQDDDLLLEKFSSINQIMKTLEKY